VKPGQSQFTAFLWIDNPRAWREFSHIETTLVKADDKGRVSIRGTRKGAKYLLIGEFPANLGCCLTRRVSRLFSTCV
jgi:hypothetical protein